jgi:hypothetical protein
MLLKAAFLFVLLLCCSFTAVLHQGRWLWLM